MQNGALQASLVLSPVLFILLSILLFASCMTILVLDVNVWFKIFLMAIITLYLLYFVYKQTINTGNKLRFELGQWFLVDKAGYEVEYKLFQISKILNLGYTLNLSNIDTSETTYLHLWKSNLSVEFQSMLSQIYEVGLATKKE